MPPRRIILGFCWRFTLWYGLLLVSWPGFNAAYGLYFRALGQRIFAEENNRRMVRFEAVPEILHRGLDTRIALGNRAQFDRDGKGPVIYLELDTRGIGWIPTALIFALVCSTPVAWRRRVRALLWGLLAVHGYIIFSLAIYLWNNSTDLSLLTLSPFAKQITAGLEETLITQMGASFIAPIWIWVLVTLRIQDIVEWQRGQLK